MFGVAEAMVIVLPCKAMLWTIDDFLQADFPEAPAVIKPILPTMGLMLIHGQQTSGKTQLALDIALSVARGDLFLDLYPCERGPVVYFQFDQPRRMFQSRIHRAQDRARNQPFYVVSDFGYHNILKWAKKPTDTIKAAQDLEPALVVFDSFQRCHQLDENLAGSIQAVYTAMHSMFPKSSKVTLHHENKNTETAASHKMRGSTALLDDANAGIRVHRKGRGKGGTHRASLEFTKVSTIEEPKPINVLMDPRTLLMEREETPTSRELAQSYLWAKPETTLHEMAEFLVDHDICGKSNAYQIGQELGL